MQAAQALDTGLVIQRYQELLLRATNPDGSPMPTGPLIAAAEAGIDPRTLCFEITETAAITKLRRATAFIVSLKTLGCRFAADDFGSGLSSFGYLKNLAVDFLKLDGAFVRDIVTDPTDRAMVGAIASVGRAMNIPTIAEWVEDDAVRGQHHAEQRNGTAAHPGTSGRVRRAHRGDIGRE